VKVQKLWVEGYPDLESADLTLQMQMRRAIQKVKRDVSVRPEAAAAYSLMTLATAAFAARPALRTITSNQAASPILTVGEVNAGILPS
jgi:hypothetical protein